MPDLSRFRRTGAALIAVTAAAAVLAIAPNPSPAGASVSDDLDSYTSCGRVFPDPHAFWTSGSEEVTASQLPTRSPWAKGALSCAATDFLGWDETIDGLRFLEELLPGYVEVYDLSDPDGPLADSLDLDGGEGSSAGLPTTDGERESVPMYLVRITDEDHGDISIDDREHFVFGLSIHGIERAGAEGGIRAAEDLATWAACEADSDAVPTCAANGPYPHPILETLPDDSISAGETLQRTSLWFALLNPDGWRRGDKELDPENPDDIGVFYQRYNGNGMDLNRDWANQGFTFRPFTPFSEPETRGMAKALKAIKSKWTGGMDLHGQLIDRAFSFTLIGGNQRAYDKDRRVLQFVKGAWNDAEERLSWSPVIKRNDEPEACVPPGTGGVINEPPDCDPLPRMYGVQWGTIWDTIAYTTPGAFGDWVDSPIGLDADGIDNEMSLSHLSNCGIGTCYLTEFEQLHVDGNKSLIYSMIHYSLLPEDTGFRFTGRAGWLQHDGRITHDGSPLSTAPSSDLPQQDPISIELLQPASTSEEFEVLGTADGVHNGGMYATFTAPNVQGVSTFAAQNLSIERMVDGAWEVVNSYYNQSPTYLQAGARIDVNLPEPGDYRVVTSGEGVGPVQVEITFTEGPSWPDPGQLAYDVSNLDFFDDLAPFAGGKLEPARLDDLLAGDADLGDLDSLVIADGAYLPGYLPPFEPPAEEEESGGLPIDLEAQAAAASPMAAFDDADEEHLLDLLRSFVEGGGNLILTDDGLRVLERLGVVPEGSVTRETVYAGHVQFSTDDGETDTYADPLAANIDQPGAAEGPGHRHQMSEPVPTGWEMIGEDGADKDSMPQWVVDRAAFEDAGGRVVGFANGGVTLGELSLGKGRIRILGSLLPMPTAEFDHPYGLSSYGVTYSGYEVLRNLLDWANPTRADSPTGPTRLPATGGSSSSPIAVLASAGMLALAGLILRRLRRTA